MLVVDGILQISAVKLVNEIRKVVMQLIARRMTMTGLRTEETVQLKE